MTFSQNNQSRTKKPQSLVDLTGRANKAIWAFITHHTEAIGGVTGMQANVLLLLKGGRRMTSQDLAKHYKLQPSAITRLVDCLVDQSLAARLASTHDRRVSYVRLTEEGASLAKRLAPVYSKSLEMLMDGIGDSEAGALRNGLERILLNAQVSGDTRLFGHKPMLASPDTVIP